LEKTHFRFVAHFNRFVFHHPLKQFATTVSIGARNFRVCYSSLDPGFRSFARMLSPIVHDFNRYACHHQLKQFPGNASQIVSVLRL
jgi:hypothetical protein